MGLLRAAVGAALLKMREVVLLKVILEALGEGCGSRSNRTPAPAGVLFLGERDAA